MSIGWWRKDPGALAHLPFQERRSLSKKDYSDLDDGAFILCQIVFIHEYAMHHENSVQLSVSSSILCAFSTGLSTSQTSSAAIVEQLVFP